jgi:hypothetical protein
MSLYKIVFSQLSIKVLEILAIENEIKNNSKKKNQLLTNMGWAFLRWGLTNRLPRLALNNDLPHLCLPSS